MAANAHVGEQIEVTPSEESLPNPDTDYAAFPAWLRAQEELLWRARRKAARCDPPQKRYVEEDTRAGLALSGGGIRSATFCLGVLRALARQQILRRFDYLSTVSGGGYVGAFLGALHLEPARELEGKPGAPTDATSYVEQVLTAPTDAWPIKWLRDNGRYLAPSGTGANWIAGAVLLRNWIALQFVFLVGTFWLACFGLVLKTGGLCLVAQLGGRPHLLDLAPVEGNLWVSPAFVLALAAFVLWALPSGTAYWLVRTARRSPVSISMGRGAVLPIFRWLLVLLGVGGVVAGLVPLAPQLAVVPPLVWLGVASWIVLTVVAWLFADGWRQDTDGVSHFKTTRWTSMALQCVVGLCAIAAVDTLGQTIYAHAAAGQAKTFWLAVAATLGAAAPVVTSANRILAAFGASKKGAEPSPLLRTLAVSALAVLLLALVGTLASVGAHALAWHGRLPTYVVDQLVATTNRAEVIAVSPADFWSFAWPQDAWGILACSGIALAVGQFHAFVHGSSLANLYASRLTRAYLGAANPDRIDASPVAAADTPFSRTEPMPRDHLPLEKYVPHAKGGPLHIINVTVNETMDPRSALREPDRKGLPMAIGPAAVDVGVYHHASRTESSVEASKKPAWANGGLSWLASPAWDRDVDRFRVFPNGGNQFCERLDLGEWIAISGAAVGPGLGSRTRLARSILLTAFNLRLGTWWDSGVDPAVRRERKGALATAAGIAGAIVRELLPVYSSFFFEAFARFPGTARRRWYLSDGGHFENTGCYELVRRRLPIIVCCDAGADPEYLFEDVGNLVRLARVDFGAEIEFLDEATLDSFLAASVRPFFGTLDQIRRAAKNPARGDAKADAQPAVKRPYGALARIRYGADETWPNAPRAGLLVVIKPLVSGAEPHDVLAYRASHESFPQQSTADQFFDDAQWEAYRRLGEEEAGCLFKTLSGEQGWSPQDLRNSALA